MELCQKQRRGSQLTSEYAFSSFWYLAASAAAASAMVPVTLRVQQEQRPLSSAAAQLQGGTGLKSCNWLNY